MTHKYDVVAHYGAALRLYQHEHIDIQGEEEEFVRVLDEIEFPVVRQTLINEIAKWSTQDYQIGVPYVIITLDALRLGQRLALM